MTEICERCEKPIDDGEAHIMRRVTGPPVVFCGICSRLRASWAGGLRWGGL